MEGLEELTDSIARGLRENPLVQKGEKREEELGGPYSGALGGEASAS